MNYLQNRNRSTDRVETCGCQGGGWGVEWTGSLGLVDVNCCI